MITSFGTWTVSVGSHKSFVLFFPGNFKGDISTEVSVSEANNSCFPKKEQITFNGILQYVDTGIRNKCKFVLKVEALYIYGDNGQDRIV